MKRGKYSIAQLQMNTLMIDIDEIFTIKPFSLKKQEKLDFYTKHLFLLTKKNYDFCFEYRKILDSLRYDFNENYSIEDIPFLPVRIFKEFNLSNVKEERITKTITSSGTSGQKVSKINLDSETSTNQKRALAKICSDFLGNKRLPLLIIDSKAVLKDRNMFSARGAGILGFSIFGRNRLYCLDENMELDLPSVQDFIEKHKGEKILLFGFTYIVWVHFYRALLESGCNLSLDNAVLIHGGGWKKLENQAVSNEDFKQALRDVCGDMTILNYYGMAEQTGSIFMECEYGRLHASTFSDVIIRNPVDFSVCGHGEKGLVQLLSFLPASYPGHSILSEDIGEIIGEDDCPCGRYGKTFAIHGRIKDAEIRGCSDTYEG